MTSRLESSGIEKLDRLLGGGYPVPAAVLVGGPLESGKDRLLYRFVQSSISSKDYCLYVTKSRVSDVVKDAQANGVETQVGVTWVASEGGDVRCDVEDLASLSFSLKDLLRKNEGRRIRIVFDVLSPLLMSNPPESVYKFVDQLIEEIKRYSAVLLATVEQDMHSPQVLASMENLFDGVLMLEMGQQIEGSFPMLVVKKMKGVALTAGARKILFRDDTVGGVSFPGFAPESAGLEPNVRRLAVLPFDNISPDAGDEYFSEGLTEELITVLSRVQGLQVIARTSVLGYKGGAKQISAIGDELHVGSILEGSVRKAASKIRVTAQLIDTRSQSHLWSDTFDRELNDIFAVQIEIAENVASALRLKLVRGGGSPGQPTFSTDAYTLYLKGRFSINKHTKDSFLKAIEFFNEAVKLDPHFAQAYAWTANAYVSLGYFEMLPSDQALSNAKAFAEKALALDDGLADAHLALGRILNIHDWSFEEAEREFRRAIELDPNLVSAHVILALMLYGDEAIAEADKAVELDPFSVDTCQRAGTVYLYARQYDKAIEQYQRVLELDPNHAFARDNLGLSYVQKGMVDLGIEEIRRSVELEGENPGFRVDLAYAYAKSGRMDDVRKILKDMLEIRGQFHKVAYFIAGIYANLGEKEKALEWLENAFAEHSPQLPGIRFGFEWDGMRSDPRFEALVKRIQQR